MTKESADRVKQIREFAAAGWLMKPEDCMFVLSQLSASEERVRELTELLRQSIAYFNGYVQDEAVEEEICVDHEHHVAAQKFKQALKEAESLLPSPPQVDIRG